MDLVKLTRKPPTPPPNVDNVFYLTIVLLFVFQFLDIIFTLKVKKNVDLARNPPPHYGLNPSKCFF